MERGLRNMPENSPPHSSSSGATKVRPILQRNEPQIVTN